MAVVSTFYDTIPGKGVNELEWAVSAPSRGALYGVDGKDDLRLTAHPATANMVVLSTGQLWGQGVWDIVTEPVNVQCVAPAAGVTRWDLICARRDWQATGGGPTAFVAVQGVSTPSIPNGRYATPGEIDDQPLWLVRWTGGQSQPTQIIDLRCWAGNGGMIAADLLALDYLARPGADVLIGNTTYRFALGANNVWGWVGDSTLSMYGVGQALSGLPPAGAKFLVQAGTIVLKTDPQGYSGFNWPKEFPNGLLTLDLRSGDEFANGIGTTITPTGGTFWGTQGAGDKKGIIYSVASSAGVRRGNLTHRVNYTAIGW